MCPQPLSPYAVQKLTGEEYARAFHVCYGLETITLRYFNVFGPRQDPKSQYAAAIPAFVSAILHGQAPTIYGDGEQLQTRPDMNSFRTLSPKLFVKEVEFLATEYGVRISLNDIIFQQAD